MISPPTSLSICLSFCPSVHLQDCPAGPLCPPPPSPPLAGIPATVRPWWSDRASASTFPCACQSHVHQQGISYVERQGHGDSDGQVGVPRWASHSWSTHVLSISCCGHLLKGQFIHKKSLTSRLLVSREKWKPPCWTPNTTSAVEAKENLDGATGATGERSSTVKLLFCLKREGTLETKAQISKNGWKCI